MGVGAETTIIQKSDAILADTVALTVDVSPAMAETGGTGSGPKCTISNTGQLVYCYDFGTGYTDSNVGQICDVNVSSILVGARVSSCPSGNVVGTCTVTAISGNTTAVYTQLYYGSNSMTCEAAKQICGDANTYTNGIASSTFVGNGCGTNAGAYTGSDLDAGSPTVSEAGSATCVLSSGTISNSVPCSASMLQTTASGLDVSFSIQTVSGNAFSFVIFDASPETGTYTSDGSRKATADVHDGPSHEWQMFDHYTGEPQMGSYTLKLTEVTETSTVPTIMRTWTVHGSLDVLLDPFTESGATGELSAHIYF
jgi:hypothetical protein